MVERRQKSDWIRVAFGGERGEGAEDRVAEESREALVADDVAWTDGLTDHGRTLVDSFPAPTVGGEDWRLEGTSFGAFWGSWGPKEEALGGSLRAGSH